MFLYEQAKPIMQKKPGAAPASIGGAKGGKSGASSSKGGGKGIPSATLSKLENTTGVSFDDVNVHYNSAKPAGVGALAYTQGTDVYVGPGQERHLSHELGHVMQQKQGRVKPTGKVGGADLNADPKLEKEADNFKI